MCGRYTLVRLSDFLKMASVARGAWPNWEARYNIAPSQAAPVVRRLPGDEAMSVGLLKWGLIPGWAKEKPKHQPINARGETAAKSPMFREAMERRRCLVPADGFYEWQGERPPKRPFFIRMKDEEPFAFAGLWERWHPHGQEEAVETFTILTIDPNALVAPIHNRMPVILSPGDYERWVDPGVKAEGVADLIKPFTASQMMAHEVSAKVNSPKNDDPSLVEAAD